MRTNVLFLSIIIVYLSLNVNWNFPEFPRFSAAEHKKIPTVFPLKTHHSPCFLFSFVASLKLRRTAGELQKWKTERSPIPLYYTIAAFFAQSVFSEIFLMPKQYRNSLDCSGIISVICYFSLNPIIPLCLPESD